MTPKIGELWSFYSGSKILALIKGIDEFNFISYYRLWTPDSRYSFNDLQVRKTGSMSLETFLKNAKKV